MQKHLIIDTNLLLLWVIGAIEGGKHIKNSKRLKKFSRKDYDNILKIISNYDAVFITPYIATEVSNLIDLKGYARILAYEMARTLFTEFGKINVDIDEDCQSELFLQFGITDNSLIQLAQQYFILTNDTRMLDALFKSNKATIIPYYSNLNEY